MKEKYPELVERFGITFIRERMQLPDREVWYLEPFTEEIYNPAARTVPPDESPSRSTREAGSNLVVAGDLKPKKNFKKRLNGRVPPHL